jgi:hypothetical protein
MIWWEHAPVIRKSASKFKRFHCVRLKITGIRSSGKMSENLETNENQSNFQCRKFKTNWTQCVFESCEPTKKVTIKDWLVFRSLIWSTQVVFKSVWNLDSILIQRLIQSGLFVELVWGVHFKRFASKSSIFVEKCISRVQNLRITIGIWRHMISVIFRRFLSSHLFS